MRMFLCLLLFVVPLSAQTEDIDAVSLQQFVIQQEQQLEQFKQQQIQRLELLKQQQVLVSLLERVNHQKALMAQLGQSKSEESIAQLQDLQGQIAQQAVDLCPT